MDSLGPPAAIDLVSYCRNVDQARFLIENAEALESIRECLKRNPTSSDGELAQVVERATGRSIDPEKLAECVRWLNEVGLVQRKDDKADD